MGVNVDVLSILSKKTIHHSGTTGNANGAAASLDGYGVHTVEVSGTFSATVYFEGTIGNSVWFPVRGTNLETGNMATQTTTPGQFLFATSGLSQFRARVGNYVSGSVTVIGNSVPGAVPATQAGAVAGTVAIDQSTPGVTNGVSLSGSFDTFRTPVVGVKTVTATAAEIFAGTSALSGRRKMLLKNEDPVLRFRVGPSSVTQQNGFPVEPGAVLELTFDPNVPVPVYAVSEGASLIVAVMEL